ncbi:putative 3-demethylubiquinone-9 3-methyltransferase (glyoxalase superfamily) [Isoptericola jiangsuensis]|uniref:Putative 3-demethylubiquinone-9 3-methyltransferase (Glyoxalase superfamily) n=1 Tax=Isoptericola jiangsuensis TaxID=548579 RepID=A0A2A9EW35_9MICO|nr:VOC family protein [Isoptericola jiangsuensis]PFG42369.1 putative 3-demethylubiquinone-9 3-methyltransferase (glyoxalase superfamily) [Isoptericola jiangsuensis]
MVTVRPHLWFADDNAHEAAVFYAEHVPDSRVGRVLTAPEGVPGATAGKPFIVEFTVGGIDVIGLNAGPALRLDEAFSLYLLCDGQEEVDRYWDLFTADGGKPGQCGWCTDRFGVSWQVIPRQLEELSGDYSTPANRRVMEAMLQMTKIDVPALEAAHRGD